MSYVFDDFDQAIDRVHDLFDRLDDGGPFLELLGEDGMHVMRLMVHEWIANLIQHATFRGKREILLDLGIDGDAVRCTVEDSSLGFDFAGQIEEQQAILNAPSPSERGRGLLMLVTCAEDLEFRPAGAGARQRVAWALRDPAGGNLGRLFRPADLQPEDSFFLDHSGDGSVASTPTPRPQ